MTLSADVARSGPATPIGFSTLACPEWGTDEVIERAASFGYDAIEWRGGPDGHVNPSWSATRRAALRRRMDEAGLQPIAVTAYTSFVEPAAAARRASSDDLVAHLELAADLGAGAVRAFIGIPSEPAALDVLTQRAIESLAGVAETAATLGVAIAIEPHDDFVRSAPVARILAALDHPAIGAVWDIANAWSAGEEPDVGAALLGPWIRYVQVKDGIGQGADWQLTEIGAGQVPLAAALSRLAADGQLPPLSVEWERAWHPELAPAAEVLGLALAMVRSLARTAVGGGVSGRPPRDAGAGSAG
jgi:sugar phosphate isomerase/epimerase